MSNVCCNWSQSDRFTDRERKMLKELQQQWDSETAYLRKTAMRPRTIK